MSTEKNKVCSTEDNSSAVCPLSVLLSVLSGSWTMYILWVLAEDAARFGALKRKVEGISTKVLTERLRMLESEGILFRHYEATIPPQVTYGLTDRGRELIDILMQLNTLAQRWYPPTSPLQTSSDTL